MIPSCGMCCKAVKFHHIAALTMCTPVPHSLLCCHRPYNGPQIPHRTPWTSVCLPCQQAGEALQWQDHRHMLESYRSSRRHTLHIWLVREANQAPSRAGPSSPCRPSGLSGAPLAGRRRSRRSRPCRWRDRPSPGGFPSVICRGASPLASTCASCRQDTHCCCSTMSPDMHA